MLAEQNKSIARRFYEEVINGRSEAALIEIMSAGFVDHGAPPSQLGGLESFKQFLQMLVTAFPDLHVTVDDAIAEDDKVAVRLTVRGTHSGMLMGNIAPTGKQATWTGIDILQFADGKIIGRWSERNLLGLMRQLGVIP